MDANLASHAPGKGGAQPTQQRDSAGLFLCIEGVEGAYEKTPQEIHGEIWAKVKELARYE